MGRVKLIIILAMLMEIWVISKKPLSTTTYFLKKLKK